MDRATRFVKEWHTLGRRARVVKGLLIGVLASAMFYGLLLADCYFSDNREPGNICGLLPNGPCYTQLPPGPERESCLEWESYLDWIDARERGGPFEPR